MDYLRPQQMHLREGKVNGTSRGSQFVDCGHLCVLLRVFVRLCGRNCRSPLGPLGLLSQLSLEAQFFWTTTWTVPEPLRQL